MKPRTKLQHEVIDASRRLIDSVPSIRQWAIDNCTDHLGYATKHRVICLDCGNKFSTELIVRKRAICPHCSTKLKIEQTKKSTNKQYNYFAIAEVYGEFQVIRNYEIIAHYKSGKEAIYYISEILQHWILPSGKREVVALRHTLNWNCDSWNGQMEIRKDYRPQWANNGSNKYDVYPSKYHPESVFQEQYTKYGIDTNLQGLTFLEAIQVLPFNSKAETLLKAKQWSLLTQCANNGKVNYFWPSIKICLRNKYKVKDGSIYLDYLNLLHYLKKDIRNAHYVCPKDLIKAHDYYVKKKRKHDALLEAERKRKKQLQDEAMFQQLKSRFFGISFCKDNIEVRVLGSIQDYMIEGDLLKHCVFTNEYYLEPDTLCLSVVVSGVRMETVEVCLKTFKVLQCRGKFNQDSEHHESILKLVRRNMKMIKERAKEMIEEDYTKAVLVA